MMRIRMLFITVLLCQVAFADQQQVLWPDSVAAREATAAPVSSLVDGLVARLHENPDDAGGWLLLAKSYRFLERPADAGPAYRRAAALGRTDAELEAWLAANEEELAIVRDWIADIPDNQSNGNE